MTLDQYQEAARRTQICDFSEDKLEHALFDLASEAGEAAGILQKTYQGHPHPFVSQITENHLVKELGDVLWMIAEAADAIGVSLDYIARINLQKLKDRYPNGFEIERSLHRKEGDV